MLAISTARPSRRLHWFGRISVGVLLAGSCLGLNAAAHAENPGHMQRLLMTRFCNRCNLKTANLAGKNLQGARITDTKLKRANLKGANLKFAILRDVSFKNADLTNADLTGAMLQNVNFKGAILEGAKLPVTARPSRNRPQPLNIKIDVP